MKISNRPYNGICNTDENKVPPFEIPSPLKTADGGTIRNAFEWMNFQRPELLNLFRDEMYGWMPPRPDRMYFETISENWNAFDGTAIRREIRIHCEMNHGGSKYFDLLLYCPKKIKAPVPVFLGLNGRGNHAASPEKEIRITQEPVVNWSAHEVFAT